MGQILASLAENKRIEEIFPEHLTSEDLLLR